MKIKVFKYKLQAIDKQILTLPFGSKIMSSIEQKGNVVLYALVDEEQGLTENYEILIIGTGNPINYSISKHTFLNTVILLDGNLVFHIFYRLIT